MEESIVAMIISVFDSMILGLLLLAVFFFNADSFQVLENQGSNMICS